MRDNQTSGPLRVSSVSPATSVLPLLQRSLIPPKIFLSSKFLNQSWTVLMNLSGPPSHEKGRNSQ